MSVYVTDHAGALADVRAAGAAVTCTGSGVAGYAVRTKGDPTRYERLKLVESEAPTLLFVPSTFGGTPALNDLVTFGGTQYAVTDIDTLAPDGTAILHKIVVTR